ncbi:sensor histidine kinase [Lampropedia aestuarii]|uniref:sensor histidine kinase n=1 Tax=Lampropedia aestuarii TaxID=2562762 RepID=UPI0024696D7B|nr:sensor histidine kinase [Lampropedia aestuarii]MDH5859220.1 sensor histidine kinase [Lampropedia aestuarii]
MAYTPSRKLGLTSRLLLLGLVPGIVLSLALGWLLDSSIQASLYGGLAQRLNERADRIQANMSLSPAGQWRYEPGRSSDEFSHIFSGWYWVLQTPDQQLVSRSLWDASLRNPSSTGDGMLLTNTDPRDRPLMGIERSIALDGIHTAKLYVYALEDEVHVDLSRVRRILWLALSALLLCMAVATFIQVRVGLQPLQLLRQRLTRLHATDSGTPQATHLGTGYGPDLDPLAVEVDALLERNARMVARGRAHAADLSHALKTPLARLNAEAGRAAQVPSHLVQEQVQSINGLLERHLSRTSAAGDQAPPLQKAVNLQSVATQLVQLMQHIHPERRLDWQVHIPHTLHWRGDRSDLEEMLGNLLDNASKWAKQQVCLEARLLPGSSPAARGQIAITITDDGPGIAEHQLSQAGQRGERFDQNTPGTGLGLSIVADIAHTWNGTLQLSASPLGGLQAQITLPA